MQDCFRLHPELYGSELEDEEDGIEDELRTRENGSSSKSEDEILVQATESTAPVAQKATGPGVQETASNETPGDKQSMQQSNAQPDDSTQTSSDAQVSSAKDNELIPKALHDATKK